MPTQPTDMTTLAADLRWAASRLEDENPDNSYEFSEGVDWAVARLRQLFDQIHDGTPLADIHIE